MTVGQIISGIICVLGMGLISWFVADWFACKGKRKIRRTK